MDILNSLVQVPTWWLVLSVVCTAYGLLDIVNDLRYVFGKGRK